MTSRAAAGGPRVPTRRSSGGWKVVFARRFVRLAVVGALSLGACQEADPERRFPLREPLASPRSSDTLVVGFVGTLSGPASWRGEDAFEGADLAVHVLNRGRPKELAPFELVQLDDEGDPEAATALIEDLAALGSTVGVVYAGPPEGLPPAEDALARAGIPAVLCYGDLHAAGRLRGHLFQASPSLVWEARALVRYLARDRGYLQVGALAERGFHGDAALGALRAAFSPSRARLTVSRYGSGGAGLREALGRLRRRRTEAVVLQGGPRAVSDALGHLRAMGARYRTTAAARIASATRRQEARRRASAYWHPQPVGLDLAVSPRVRGAPNGMVAPETYARAAHVVPIPSLARFRRDFRSWWGSSPTGWQLRAYDAVRALGWAALRAQQEDDLAEVLEDLRGRRFGGLPVTFSNTDHVAPEARTVGLWVVPSPGARLGRFARQLRAFGWSPLARSFAPRGRAPRVLEADRAALFGEARGPRLYSDMRFGVTTSPRDNVH